MEFVKQYKIPECCSLGFAREDRCLLYRDVFPAGLGRYCRAAVHHGRLCLREKQRWMVVSAFMVGNIVKRICTMAWCVTALAAVAWYTQSRQLTSVPVKGDHVYGDVAREFLPDFDAWACWGSLLLRYWQRVMSSCDCVHDLLRRDCLQRTSTSL